MHPDLRVFVREALARGVAREEIRRELAAARWRTDEIDAALDEWVDGSFPVPVPRRKVRLSAREAFLHLVLFATLYVAAFETGAIAFTLIERWLPDRAMTPYALDPRLDGLRWAVAALMIALPVFLYTNRLITRAIAREPEQRGSGVRRWLTYLTLFVAALVLIGDFVAVVRGLLSGELVPRFLLKASVVAAIAGVVFRHYLDDLRRDESESPARAGAWLARIGVAAMIAAALGGLLVIGTPGRARVRQFDALRVSAIQNLSNELQAYAMREKRLPVSLAELRTGGPNVYGGFDPLDPETRLPYEYAVTDSMHYQLCAVFTAADSVDAGGSVNAFWKHAAGRSCWSFTIPRSVLEGR